MSEVLDLFGHAAARKYPNAPGHTGSATSKAAAASMLPHYTKQQRAILDHLLLRGADGSTYTEIVTATGISAQSICGRMVELVNAKAVRFSPDVTRPTPSGRKARVYVATEQA